MASNFPAFKLLIKLWRFGCMLKMERWGNALSIMDLMKNSHPNRERGKRKKARNLETMEQETAWYRAMGYFIS